MKTDVFCPLLELFPRGKLTYVPEDGLFVHPVERRPRALCVELWGLLIFTLFFSCKLPDGVLQIPQGALGSIVLIYEKKPRCPVYEGLPFAVDPVKGGGHLLESPVEKHVGGERVVGIHGAVSVYVKRVLCGECLDEVPGLPACAAFCMIQEKPPELDSLLLAECCPSLLRPEAVGEKPEVEDRVDLAAR